MNLDQGLPTNLQGAIANLTNKGRGSDNPEVVTALILRMNEWRKSENSKKNKTTSSKESN